MNRRKCINSICGMIVGLLSSPKLMTSEKQISYVKIGDIVKSDGKLSPKNIGKVFAILPPKTKEFEPSTEYVWNKGYPDWKDYPTVYVQFEEPKYTNYISATDEIVSHKRLQISYPIQALTAIN